MQTALFLCCAVNKRQAANWTRWHVCGNLTQPAVRRQDQNTTNTHIMSAVANDPMRIEMFHEHAGVSSEFLPAVLRFAQSTADTCVVTEQTPTKLILEKTKTTESGGILQAVKIPKTIQFTEVWQTEHKQGRAPRMLMTTTVDLNICVLRIGTMYEETTCVKGDTGGKTDENGRDNGLPCLTVKSVITIEGDRIDPLIRTIISAQSKAQFKQDRVHEAKAFALSRSIC